MAMALVMIAGTFGSLAYAAERSRDWRIKLVLYLLFAASVAGLLTFGAQSGVLFDGRARAGDWVTEMLLPSFYYTVWIASIMYLFAPILYRAIPSILVFTIAYCVTTGVVAVVSAIVLVALLTS